MTPRPGGGWVRESGSVLIATFAVMIVLINLVAGFLYAAGVFTLSSGWEETDAKLLWLADAGLHKAVWNLMTPVSGGGQGEGWTTAGATENLGDGSYTMVVERWDFALAANGATASDNPAQTKASQGPAKAIDGNDGTFWQSKNEPDADDPQDLIIAFPYPLVLNKVRFLVSGPSSRIPEDYTWAVSTNGTTYTTVVTVSGNAASDRTDTFSAQSNVTTLRLRVTEAGNNVRIAALEAIGARVTSTGTITATGQSYTRTVRQAVVADDASPQSQVSYVEPDWVEP